MAKKLHSLTSLTEFAPLSPEGDSKSFLFRNIFKRNKENSTQAKDSSGSCDTLGSSIKESVPHQPGLPSQNESKSEDKLSESYEKTKYEMNQGNVGDFQNRNMASVLKMVRSIMEGKKMGLQSYKDSDFKQYWMPDSNCKECYECGDKFTTFRRRHHCRVCGQIFCWRCCNQGIPGNLIGYSGDLRVCSYCHKMVFSCMQSLDLDSEVQDDLQSFHDIQNSLSSQTQSEWVDNQQNVSIPARRKSSVMGFREEDIAKAKSSKSTLSDFCCDVDYGSNMSLESSSSLRDRSYVSNLFSKLTNPECGIYRNKDMLYSSQAQFIQGTEIVDWLLNQGAASSVNEAVNIGQSFLDTHCLESRIPGQSQFMNSDVLYKLRGIHPELQRVSSASENQESMEPLWVKEIQNENSCTAKGTESIVVDSESICETVSDNQRSEPRSRIPSSSSSFFLDLDVKESRVKVSRPMPSDEREYTSLQEYTVTYCNKGSSEEIGNVDLDMKYLDDGMHDTFAENLLKAFGANLLNKASSKSSQDSYTTQQLKDENEKRVAFEGLNLTYKNLETNLLRQLLESNALSSTWCDTILPIVHHVIDTVHPDVKNDVDSMDIRQYVQFKKIPGGSKSECNIVNGIVFSKSVAHRKMEQNIFKPAVLLLTSPITYQRIENKLSSLDPLIMQEFEYLKNTIGKLTVCKPDVLLVEKSVSRVAQEMLLSLGITVALNVKSTVMERVARCTKAAVVSTVDAHLGKPQLGTCQEFKVKTYTIFAGKTKALMFLDGCPADLGCTILLRGGTASELKKVKQIVQFMLYVAYNWRLELSFLMDEFALPPTNSVDKLLDSPENEADVSAKDDLFEATENRISGDISTYNTESVVSSSIKGKAKSDDASRRLETTCVDDYSDPLHSYLQSDSDIIFSDTSDFKVDILPMPNTFRKLLDDIILCCSLNVKVSLPYLETEEGKRCPLRKFFSEEIYWSAHFQKEGTKTLHSAQIHFDDENESFEIQATCGDVEIRSLHDFITHKFVDTSYKNQDIFSLLADFRARGSTIKCLCPHQCADKGRDRRANVPVGPCGGEKDKSKTNETTTGTSLFWERKVDALDPYNHQTLAVLFCSYSCASNNAPNYCVNPWIVKMDFYGSNDIPFGGFLEKYCFRSSYVCPSQSCDTPMTGHVRKFVHGSGCVHIVLLEYSSGVQTADTNILMWSWCPKCKQASSVVPMSQETWSFSFAKYLELRFYASAYKRQATNNLCTHSLHHGHNQYFAHKQIVAIFEYSPISVWKIVLPSISIFIKDEAVSVSTVVDQIKNIAVKGSEIYSTILEKLCAFKQQYAGANCEDIIANMIATQKVEMCAFREKIEKIQLRVTSPTLEYMQVNLSQSPEKNVNKGICNFMWKVEDQVTLLKYHIAEAVQLWNIRIQEFVSARKKEEKQAPKPYLPAAKVTENEETVTHTSASSNDDCAMVLQKCDQGSNVSKVCESSVSATNTVKDSTATAFISQISNNSSSQQNESGSSVSWNHMFRKNKLRNHSWVERSVSCESISESLKSMNFHLRLTKSLSEPTNVSCGVLDFNSAKKEIEEDRCSVSSSTSSYTYGVTPGIYAGLMVPEPEENESYVICHKDHNEQNSNGFSGRGHERSKSEGHQMSIGSFSKAPQEHEESTKRDKKERTVKTLLSQFLSSSDVILIQSPFPATEHAMPVKCDKEIIPVIVYDDEPSSIIAHTLASPEYEQKLQEIRVNVATAFSTTQRDSQTSSPMIKRRQNSKPSNDSTLSSDGVSFLHNDDSTDFLDLVTCSSQETEKSSSKYGTKLSNFHLEVQFNDSSARFYCRVYYAEQFRKLRCLVFSEGEERFIRSLSHCVPWVARGGKSGSTFCKTSDDRFILKQMQKLELQSFLDLAPSYFQYVNKAYLEQKPLLLAKIVGVYRIGYKNTVTNSASKMDLLVMENLFYGCNVTKKYDLKGSVRNRLVNTSGLQEDDIVLLDENLLKITCDNPLYIRPHSKSVISLAIDNDTQFLADQSVMDYSLLVGMDEEKKELVVGIIDYIRTFTWDKKVEMLVKSSGILGGHGKMPTVVSPELYRMRFREAMDGYFLWVPDRWTNLGKDVSF